MGGSLSTLAFRPPRPPTPGSLLVGSADAGWAFADGWSPQLGLAQPRSPIRIAAAAPPADVVAGLRARVLLLRDGCTPALHVTHAPSPPSPPSPDRLTLLFSHGTSFDLGLLRDHVTALAAHLRVDCLAYDYQGYGAASLAGAPTEAGTNADAEAALEHLTGACGIPVGRLLLYGLSLGSMPAMHLAAGPGRGAAGVVIRSGASSGAGVLFGRRLGALLSPLLPFNNRRRCGAVTAPVLVMHGGRDELVGLWHAVELAARCPAAVEPLLLPERGHFNIEASDEYLPRLARFVEAEARRGG